MVVLIFALQYFHYSLNKKMEPNKEQTNPSSFESEKAVAVENEPEMESAIAEEKTDKSLLKNVHRNAGRNQSNNNNYNKRDQLN